MSEDSKTAEIRRILVALGSYPEDAFTLRLAARLAAGLHAELRALYIQDSSLIRFAELPIAVEVITHSAIERNIDPSSIERDLVAYANRISRDLAQLAAQQRVRWSFETIRGQVESEVLAATEQADLLIVNRKTGRMMVSQNQLGSWAAVIATKSQRTVLLLEEQDHLDKPLVILLEDMVHGVTTLTIALRLSQSNHRKLIVLIAAESVKTFQQLKTQVEKWFEMQRRHAHFTWLRKAEPTALAHALWQEGGGVLLVSANTPLLKRENLAELMRQLRLPIVLVR